MNLQRALVSGVLAAFTILGCSDTTDPITADSGDGFGDFQGQIDPTAGTFVMKTLDVPHPDGTPVRIELLGRFVRDRTIPERPGEVPFLVSIRNIDHRSLYAPAEIALSRFEPTSVSVLNSDWTTCGRDSTGDSTFVKVGDECYYGFNYTRLLGEDGVLSPGETSGERLWVFYDPEMVSFSFAARARFGMVSGRPVIAGTFFSDPNRNGEWEDTEPTFGGGGGTGDRPGH